MKELQAHHTFYDVEVILNLLTTVLGFSKCVLIFWQLSPISTAFVSSVHLSLHERVSNQFQSKLYPFWIGVKISSKIAFFQSMSCQRLFYFVR